MDSAVGTGREYKPWVLILGSLALTVPGLLLRFGYVDGPPELAMAFFGLAILGSAFLLGSGAECAEMDISRGLALALVAMVAILPEYAVDLVFAWKAADDPIFAQYAAANMTGSNRLLIGIGWSAVVLLFWYRRRTALKLGERGTTELVFLLIATIWAFTIFLRTLVFDGTLNLLDSFVLVGLFGLYLYTTARGETADSIHGGPMASLSTLSKSKRRAIVIVLMFLPALIIMLIAEPFSESLLETGDALGIDEFILVQWLAPLASEAPEMAIAVMFALRGMGAYALGLLVSSKVNQWTLLVGTLPIVYSINLGSFGALPLDDRQAQEFLLTSAQSLFAVILLASLVISWRAGIALFILFITQVFFTDQTARLIFSLIYLGGSILVLTGDRARRTGFLSLGSEVLNLFKLRGLGR